MTVAPLIPDAPPIAVRNAAADPNEFARSLDAVGATLDRAESAEDAFAAKRGSLQEAVYERARADVALAVAAAAASRAAQSLSTVLNMSV